MSIHRQQNRETRETRAQNKRLAELKRENLQLRRRVARLQKQLQKLADIQAPGEAVEEVKPLQSPDCPNCRAANLATVKLPFGTLLCCKSCGYRKRA